MTRNLWRWLVCTAACLVVGVKATGVALGASVAPSAGAADGAVADSVAGFGYVQGIRGWTYGLAPDRGALPGGFRFFRTFRNGAWRLSGASPAIGRERMAPGMGCVVRRWRPNRAGSVRLVGTVCKPDARLGAECAVLVDGRPAWTRVLEPADTISHGYDVLLLDVRQGAAIDLAVCAPDGATGAPVDWRVKILPEPCTAWRPDLPIGPQFTDVQKVAQRDAGTRILERIAMASATGARHFTIPPGDYRFSADAGKCPTLTGIHDIAINARGVTFWFDPPHVYGLAFQDGQDVTIRGLTIDYDPCPWFQARITAIDRAAKTVTAEVMPGYEPTETGGSRCAIYYHSDGTFIVNGHIPCRWRKSVGRSVVIEAPAPGASVGDYVACPIRTGQALRLFNCGGMVFDDCNIYASGGMAVMEAGGPGGNVYREFHATRRPGTNRLHAFGADGFHLTATDHGATLDRCEIAYVADDNINIHGFFGHVLRRIAPNRYLLAGDYQPYAVGRELWFWDWATVEPMGSATVTASIHVTDEVARSAALCEIRDRKVPHSEDVWDVTLDRRLDLPIATLVDHRSRECAGFVVRNCWFHDSFNRAFLLNGSPGGTIEDNTFQNVNGGLNIHFETWAYTEGHFASRTTVRGNRFLGCSPGVASADAYFQGVIMVVIVPGGGNYLRHSMPVHDLSIVGNYIEGAGGVPIYVTNVDGLTVAGNMIDHPFGAPGWAGFAAPIASTCGDLPDALVFLAAVRHAQVAENRAYDPDEHAGGSQARLGPLTRDVTVAGERQWDAVADTITGWTPSGAQGAAGWQYGSIDAANAEVIVYDPGAFHALPVLDNGAWRPSVGWSQLPFVGLAVMHPSEAQTAVRRWTSQVSGRVRVVGTAVCAGKGNGTRVAVCLDGVRQWMAETWDGRVRRFDVTLDDVRIGSAIDITVDARGWATDDATQVYAKVLVPPASQ